MATNGQVIKVLRDKGIGFLRADGGKEYFMHRSEVVDYDGLKEGDKVTFEPDDKAPKGPRAGNVQKV
jgi:cold shock CspA family protein